MNIDRIVKVYSGKAGKCMCGCAGKWSYTAMGARDHSPGYTPSVSEKSVKMITKKVLTSPDMIVEGDIVMATEGNRIRVVYFDGPVA